MGRRAITALLGGAGLAVAACGPAEVGGTDAVRSMVLETCAPGADAAQTEVCTCAFDRLLDQLDADTIESLDRQLRDDPDTVPPEVQEAVLDCAFEQVAPPVTKPTFLATTSTTTRSP